MSMISEQIKRLREKADTFERSGSTVNGIVKEFRQAADVIEELSAKLHAANMERSSQYYNGGWIPVSEKYPEDGQRVLVDYCDEDAGIMLVRFHTNGYRGFKAWMPLPERYEASQTGAEGSDKE